MAKFLTTRGTTSEIESIINSARNRVVLMSPFIKIPESLFQNLRVADSRGVRITIVHGKKALEPSVFSQLNQLKNLELRFLENLHGKCYFKWSRHKWQKAKYCHDCVKETTTTMNKPLCRPCYSKTCATP
jgi:sugar-specific transcriptional regulator TrmB